MADIEQIQVGNTVYDVKDAGAPRASDVYSKSDTDTLLAAKADTADLGALATKDSVDYTTDVTNKPTLGTLAGKNSVDYTTEVTNKPTLGSLASKNSVDYTTDVTNTPTLGSLASKSSVDYDTEITNLPTLGALADHDTVDYTTEVDNAPTLGGIQIRPDYTISTTDLTDGSSSLETGKLYFVYEA